MVKSYGTDRYGRTLGVVFVGDLNVNLEMVKVGLALNQMSGTDPIIVSTTYGGPRAPFDIYKRDCSQAHGLSRFHIVGGKSF